MAGPRRHCSAQACVVREEMIAHWLSVYGGLDELGVQAARERHEAVKHEIRDFERQLDLDAQ